MLSLSGLKDLIRVKEPKAAVMQGQLDLAQLLSLRCQDMGSLLKNISRMTNLELVSLIESAAKPKARVRVANSDSICEFLLPEICSDLPLGALILRNQAYTGYKKIFSAEEIFPLDGVWPDFISWESRLALVFMPIEDLARLVPGDSLGSDLHGRFVIVASSSLEPQEMVLQSLLASGLVCLALASNKTNLFEQIVSSLVEVLPSIKAALVADQKGYVKSFLKWDLKCQPEEILTQIQSLINSTDPEMGHHRRSKLVDQTDLTIRVLGINQPLGEPNYLVIIQSSTCSPSWDSSDSALMRFMSSIAHEIRNPLTGIAAGVQYLARKLPPEVLESDTLSFISDEINRLNRIVEDLYRIARPPELNITEIDLPEVISKSLLSLSGLILKKQIKIGQKIAHNIPKVKADSDRLQQVLVNIIKNAIEASPERGLITIEAAEEQERIRISVRDQGSGIPEQVGERLFEPFYSTKHGGTGLGLCISKKIVEQHGGRLFYRNCDQGGAEFIIDLPIGAREDGKHSGG